MQIVGGWGGGLGAQLASRHFEATLERSLNEAAPGHQVFIIAMKEKLTLGQNPVFVGWMKT